MFLYTFEVLKEYIEVYTKLYTFEKEMKLKLENKTRFPNFPDHISENLVRFYLKKYKNIDALWKIKRKSGDLCYNKDDEPNEVRIEVKASINLENTLVTFGPREHWNIIYLIDCKNIEFGMIKIYECNISNDSYTWSNLKVNKTETFEQQCKQKRRPRINFKSLKEQLKSNIVLVFNDHYSKLQINE